MTYVRPHIIYTNKHPRFSIVLPLRVSRSLHSLVNKAIHFFFIRKVGVVLPFFLN